MTVPLNQSFVPEKGMVVAQLQTVDGELTGPPLSLPENITPQQLNLLVNQLLEQNVKSLFLYSQI